MANQFAGELHCSLIEDGTHVSTQKKALKKRYQINGRHKFLILLGIFIAGGGLGFVTMNVLLALFGG